MIDYLRGKLVFKDPTYVIIDVGGIGYHVKISLQTYSKIKDEEQIRLLTFLHIKEDAHTLYGFKEEDEKRLFLLLISINGVGPNTGLMILSSLSSEEIEQAILAGDVATIQHVKGIGAKTAQRIILELKDKVSKSGSDVSTSSLGFLKSSNKLREEALQALITLGFPKAAAEKNITQVLKKTTGEISLEDLIKASLKTT
ncbi:MAG TPA: Holliday junction branch migration protein RuvA [Algoriphagus sp.]|mgnify:CR=1 FL=1|jgi:Holliday junction DNA helicase RuvA|uniref:Holliday junction branch migration complex subunit RuvA n=3 Tax=Algoriphagus TaxID=246875 RepID=A0A1I5B6T0_9BACT|nr:MULTISPECIES: Holliday junction branch migration protein RuvA [Algoriphagus]MAL13007.1 Holliday junction branch migration protein RuvA [Algoriphagus sp.]QYH39364.1 Holliday junction branch migration protein RuvA [Algoriphagus sp. NBT04N3]SFN70402.1 Holliday junction DNA helicase subunit RuvA [Algoriphagus ornithinivorans]HAH38189.1 Holliday junction branch migration protein RuvA [Algoriphagus sp.]HAZ25904.1 Holliday junction branch migration protein RuvA [Algoriphagus sp.]|tara:strand:- start:9733 stop:10329 length:597 start_codon:yes stop_codon:yes gene_type:complete